MAGRNRMHRHPADFQGFRERPRPVMNRGPGPVPLHPVALEEEIEIQHRENQRIVVENRQLMDENVILDSEVVAAKDEIHRLAEFIRKLRADKDAKARDLIERGLKLEADLRAVEPLREEVLRLRAEAQKLSIVRQDLTAQIQGLTQEITCFRSENKQFSAMKSDVGGIRKELAEARRALEYEKKANEEQAEQKQAMENNLLAMAREIEKLRAEHLSVDRRPYGLGGAGSYGMYNGTPDMQYPSGAYADGAYADGFSGAWGPYNKRARR